MAFAMGNESVGVSLTRGIAEVNIDMLTEYLENREKEQAVNTFRQIEQQAPIPL
jgi:hypothetical protein